MNAQLPERWGTDVQQDALILTDGDSIARLRHCTARPGVSMRPGCHVGKGGARYGC